MEIDFKENKGFRLLQLYERLSRGKVIRNHLDASLPALRQKNLRQSEGLHFISDSLKEMAGWDLERRSGTLAGTYFSPRSKNARRETL